MKVDDDDDDDHDDTREYIGFKIKQRFLFIFLFSDWEELKISQRPRHMHFQHLLFLHFSCVYIVCFSSGFSYMLASLSQTKVYKNSFSSTTTTTLSWCVVWKSPKRENPFVSSISAKSFSVLIFFFLELTRYFTLAREFQRKRH